MNVQNLKFQSNKTLSVAQFRTEFINTFEYISLSNGIKNKHIEIKEINESGSVNDLLVVNRSKHFVFLSDGDVLSGAKQNRVLNTSVLLAPDSKVIIPVSCVEQGRWRYKSPDFTDSDYVAPSHMRSSKAADVKMSLSLGKEFYARQSKVWNAVSDYEKSYCSRSDTSNLSDIFDKKKEDFEETLKKFNVENDSNGIAIFIKNKLLNLEIFNQEKIYREYFPKLLKGAYFETVNLKEAENMLTEAEAFYKTQDFLDKTDSLQYEQYKGVGVGTERRFDTKEMTGFELSYETRIIHFVALNLKRV